MGLFSFLPLVVFGVSSMVADWSGQCVGIADGDTITVLSDSGPVKIRLYGVDCPEDGQDFGRRAKEFTAKMTFRKTVEITPIEQDRYGRTVAHVEVDGESVSHALVAAGLAMVYNKYCDDPICLEWQAAQDEAQAAKRGIWSRSDTIPPWEWRRSGQRTNLTQERIAQAVVFSGNRKSKVFHRPSCRHFTCKNCTASFDTREAAVAAGYKACGICRP
jgi:endonuclease YncB( thermonuclease family)